MFRNELVKKITKAQAKHISVGDEVGSDGSWMLMLTSSQNFFLGMKVCEKNPGKIFSKTKVGDGLKVRRNFTEFGLSLVLTAGLMVLFTPQTSLLWND